MIDLKRKDIPSYPGSRAATKRKKKSSSASRTDPPQVKSAKSEVEAKPPSDEPADAAFGSPDSKPEASTMTFY